MIVKLCLLWFLPWLIILGTLSVVEGWSPVLDESLDERQDAQIFRAVVESMREWELHKKNARPKREASIVCYEDVGCFEDTGPFSYLEMLPSPPKDVGTRFFVYGSRKPRSVPMEVPADDINDKVNHAIDPDLPTKVLVHGFGSDCDHVWVYEMRSALMSVHDCNIVCVDWSRGSAIPNYVRAAANTRLVGRQLAKLVRSLNVSLDKVHLIGFSLGAHVAGFAGAELANVSRITGLDPAGPLFEAQDPQVRLDETDANFVDVIHSNGEQLILGGLGSWQPMGDVDFYPNGGRMQSGCSNLFLGAVSDFIWSAGSIEGRSLCNHRRAYKFFTDSVSPKCRFPAFSCEKGYEGLLQGECFPCGPDRPCGDMGYYSDSSSARGQLYLVTRDEEPFCAHQYQIKVANSQGERPAKSYGKLQVTLVGSGSFNETFTMTRKDDEELLVGSVLHRIVVPHPVIVNLKGIEVKYTAYSGWISSGLVSWSIDKVSVLDSFGNSLSACGPGLILESGRSVYFPLYPGDCSESIAQQNNETTTSTSFSPTTVNPSEKAPAEMKTVGIGPFTKEQNFDRKDSYSVEILADERNPPRRNVGPFTKDQNLSLSPHENDEKPRDHKPLNHEEKTQNLWSFVEINEAGSNSLENTEIETGRGFSGAGYILQTSPSPLVLLETTTVEFASEIQEPVLQTAAKKETGRSMRLPEITEPILRPRTTRQNLKDTEDLTLSERTDDGVVGKKNVEETEKGFTVQFLPERLAGILAQAERYARQTFLPLISQYTPSFIGGRQEKLKYFPPLSDIVDSTSEPSGSVKNNTRSEKQMNFGESEKPKNLVVAQDTQDWVPIKKNPGKALKIEETFRSPDNHDGKWINDQKNDGETSSRAAMSDWVPIEHSRTDKVDPATKESAKVTGNNSTAVMNLTAEDSEKKLDKRFIPLVDFEHRDSYLVPTTAPAEAPVTLPLANTSSHIQRIPRPAERKSTIFPYAYDRKKDLRSRYIPLIPAEDLGTLTP